MYFTQTQTQWKRKARQRWEMVFTNVPNSISSHSSDSQIQLFHMWKVGKIHEVAHNFGTFVNDHLFEGIFEYSQAAKIAYKHNIILSALAILLASQDPILESSTPRWLIFEAVEI